MSKFSATGIRCYGNPFGDHIMAWRWAPRVPGGVKDFAMTWFVP